jgi:hypothetical protein
MGLSLFTRLSQLVKVRDIQRTLLPRLHADMTLTEAISHAYSKGLIEDVDDVLLVCEADRVVGCLDLLSLVEAEQVAPTHSVASIMKSIQHVSAETCVFDAAGFLRDRNHWAVLDKTDVTGTVCFRDLGKMPFRVILFALVLEVEEMAHELIRQSPFESWAVLSRRQKIRAIQEYSRNETGKEMSEEAVLKEFSEEMARTKEANCDVLLYPDPRGERKVRVVKPKTLSDLPVRLLDILSYLSLTSRLHVIQVSVPRTASSIRRLNLSRWRHRVQKEMSDGQRATAGPKA